MGAPHDTPPGPVGAGPAASELERRVPGLVVVERVHRVPLDHRQPEGAQLSVFSRELADPDGRERPLLVFFEGGPGFEAPRPSRLNGSPAWLEWALSQFRVLLLDQRGTGRSSPIGPALAGEPPEQADYLAHFRADSIVADAEHIRRELGVENWSVLGQSFGGCCALSYLSFAPEGLREVLISGGLPGLGPCVEKVYRATYARMRQLSLAFYERYPEDRACVLALRERLQSSPLRLPGGDRLHADRLATLGAVLGQSDGAAQLHYLLELDPDSQAFRYDAEAMTPFPRNPIYAILHEACWADTGSTRWAAERVLAEQPEWAPELFTGEHVFPWMFRDIGALAPLRDAAELLAERDWPALYDAGQLASNDVPVAAIVYGEDAYVPRAFSEQTAAGVRGLRRWLTDEYQHDGLGRDPQRLLERLLELARGRA